MWQKLGDPTAILTFLGIRLPQEKLEELKELFTKWLMRKAGRERDMPSLIGKPVHAVKNVVPGCIFLRYMLDIVHNVKHLEGGPPSITSVHSLRGMVNGFIILAVETGWSMGHTPRLLDRSMAEAARSLQIPSVGCI